MSLIQAPIGKYVVIRTYAAGVHCGFLKEYDFNNRHALLESSRRIWYWEGAFTLSAVALNGPTDGKFSLALPEIIISQVEEIIPCSDKAETILKEFKTHEPK